MTALEANDLTAGYGEMEILSGVSLDLRKNEIVSIIGPNGAGKSTLLKTIFGILQPKKGTVKLHGDDITAMRPDQIVSRGVSYVPQVDNVFRSLTVQENLEMGAYVRTDDYGKTLEDVYQLFPLLKERKSARVRNFSGGQRQMVAMARALMLDPKVLLLDEPTAGLAPLLVQAIFDKITEINEEGVAIILVEQNAREALKISHRGFVLVNGKNRMTDTGANLLANEEIGRLFLGG